MGLLLVSVDVLITRGSAHASHFSLEPLHFPLRSGAPLRPPYGNRGQQPAQSPVDVAGDSRLLVIHGSSRSLPDSYMLKTPTSTSNASTLPSLASNSAFASSQTCSAKTPPAPSFPAAQPPPSLSFLSRAQPKNSPSRHRQFIPSISNIHKSRFRSNSSTRDIR